MSCLVEQIPRMRKFLKIPAKNMNVADLASNDQIFLLLNCCHIRGLYDTSSEHTNTSCW